MILSNSTVRLGTELTGSDQAHGEELLAKARGIIQVALLKLEGIRTAGEIAKLSEAAESSRKILDPDPERRGESLIKLFWERASDELFKRVATFINESKEGPAIAPRPNKDPKTWSDEYCQYLDKLAMHVERQAFDRVLACVRDQIETEISRKIIDTDLPLIVMGLFAKLQGVEQEYPGLLTLLSSYAGEKYKWQQQGLATIEPVLNLIQERLTESRSTNDGEAVAEPSQADAQDLIGLRPESPFIMGFPGNTSIVMPKIGGDLGDRFSDPQVMASTLDWRGQGDFWQGALIVPEALTGQTEDPIPADEQKKGTAADETTSEVRDKGERDKHATVVVADMAGQNPVEARSDGREHRQPGEPVGKPETERATASGQVVEGAVTHLNEYAPSIVCNNVKWFLKRERIAVSPERFRERLNEFITGRYDEVNKSNFVPSSEHIKNLDPHFWYDMAFVTDKKWQGRLDETLKSLGYGQPTALESTSDGDAPIEGVVATQEGRVKLALMELYPVLSNPGQNGPEIEDVVEAICFFNNYGKRGASTDPLQNLKLNRNGGKLEVVMDFLKENQLVEYTKGATRAKLREDLPRLLQTALHPHAEPGKFLFDLRNQVPANASIEYGPMAS